MKRFVYLILFLVFLLILKAFYLDPYLNEKFGDTNQTGEGNGSIELNSSSNDPSKPTTAPLQPSSSAAHDKLPLDQLGDSIAEKLEDKIGKQ